MFISKALRAELAKTHHNFSFEATNALTTYDFLLTKIPTLRNLSVLHMEALSKFKKTRNIEFPALHRELFSLDINEWDIDDKEELDYIWV